jgi:hypothetical protein
MTTVSAAVAAAVAEHTGEVFALMGNGNAYFTDALARQGRVRMTAVRHEQATVASADAYQRASRRIHASHWYSWSAPSPAPARDRGTWTRPRWPWPPARGSSRWTRRPPGG